VTPASLIGAAKASAAATAAAEDIPVPNGGDGAKGQRERVNSHATTRQDNFTMETRP